MVDIRLLMELQTYTMTSKVTYDTIMVFLTVLLNGMTDVAHKGIGLGSLHAYLQTLLGHPHQLFLLRRSLADDEHTTGISIVTVEDGGKVDVDDITLLKHILLLGNAMTHHLVDARAYRHGERRSILVTAIVETGGNGMVVFTVLATDLVDLKGVHTRMDRLCHCVENTGIDNTGTTYALNLFGGLDQVTRRHLLALVLPIHDGLVHLRGFLARETVPAPLLILCCHNLLIFYFQVAPWRMINLILDFLGSWGLSHSPPRIWMVVSALELA